MYGFSTTPKTNSYITDTATLILNNIYNGFFIPEDTTA